MFPANSSIIHYYINMEGLGGGSEEGREGGGGREEEREGGGGREGGREGGIVR